MNTRARPAIALLLAAATIAAVAQVPPSCGQFRRSITRHAHAQFGPTAPVPVLASQIMQESSCNAAARSAVGAQGLAQFMPSTAAWLGTLDDVLAPANPTSVEWSLHAQTVYMAWFLDRLKGRTECDAWAFGLSGYNGGAGWVIRDKAATQLLGLDPLVWFGVVEAHPDRRRSAAAIAENRGYPRRILLELQPRFVRAGWGRPVVCGAGDAS